MGALTYQSAATLALIARQYLQLLENKNYTFLSPVNKWQFYGLLALALVVYLLNLPIDVQEVDAAQYAEMSWEMLTTKSFLVVHNLGRDYLDKPPLLFWLNSFSFYLFGISNSAYKLPSLLFALLAVYSTYRFAALFYHQQVARLAALMLATTQALFLITNDVRTDTLLMGAVIFSIWQWTAYFETRQFKYLLGGSIALALSLLAKGPVGLIALGAAMGPHYLFTRQWKKLIDVRLLLALALVAALLLPMCWGLYQQFGNKGLHFYFWTQSFGRITGESEWNNHPDPFFLLHTSAWAFQPWALFLFGGWLLSLWQLLTHRFTLPLFRENISVYGFTLLLLSLMLSKYQLPHYAFVVYPLGAVMAANFFFQLDQFPRVRRWITALQLLTLFATLPLSLGLLYAFGNFSPGSALAIALLFAVGIYLSVAIAQPLAPWQVRLLRVAQKIQSFFGLRVAGKTATNFVLDTAYQTLIPLSVICIVMFNGLLSAFWFPAILKYQPQNQFGRYIRQQQQPYYAYGYAPEFSTVFYARGMPAAVAWQPDELRNLLPIHSSSLVITTANGLQQLQQAGFTTQPIYSLPAFKVAKMNFKFINPATRPQVCETQVLAWIKTP